VARVLASIFPVLAKIDARVEQREVNGQPGAIVRDRDGKVALSSAMSASCRRREHQRIRMARNP
jgi:RNA polymerase sigma-70 factor (ECF subfamily)